MDHLHNSRDMRARRQELRNNATRQERRLWQFLRHKQFGVLFYRQHSIGPYVVDFYCPKKRLVIELDGEQHSQEETRRYDDERSDFLKLHNHNNMNAVIATI